MKPDLSLSDATMKNQALIDEKPWVRFYLGHIRKKLMERDIIGVSSLWTLNTMSIPEVVDELKNLG